MSVCCPSTGDCKLQSQETATDDGCSGWDAADEWDAEWNGHVGASYYCWRYEGEVRRQKCLHRIGVNASVFFWDGLARRVGAFIWDRVGNQDTVYRAKEMVALCAAGIFDQTANVT